MYDLDTLDIYQLSPRSDKLRPQLCRMLRLWISEYGGDYKGCAPHGWAHGIMLCNEFGGGGGGRRIIVDPIIYRNEGGGSEFRVPVIWV
jgi:hypothetical protein